MSSLARSRVHLGSFLIVAWGASIHAQQAQRPVLPEEQITVRPATMSWDELMQLQASFPEAWEVVPQAAEVLEIPPIELASPVRRPDPKGHELRGGVDESPASCPGFAGEPSVGRSFDGQLDVPDGLGFLFIPPDLAGGVGPAHLMVMLNNKVLVQDRFGATALSMDLSVFWSPLGTTPASPTTTFPRVYYDALCGRWYASARNGVTLSGLTSIFFAISRTSDPTGVWDFYSLPADPAVASFADWVLLGYNSTWITIAANMFNLAGSFLGAKMWTIDKSTALVPGGPITVSIFPTGFMATAHSGFGGSSPHPARTFDADPTLWLINDGFTSGGVFLLQLTRISGTGAAPMVSGLPGSPLGATTSFCFVTHNWSGTQRTMAQLGETRFLTPFSVRIASVAVRGGKIWVANSGGQPGPSTNGSPTSNGVLWHQLDPTLPFPPSPGAPGSMLVQSGAITNGVNTMSMYPSIAVNCADDVIVGFANGDATMYPRACYTMRLGTDPLGAMGPIRELKAGESTYWKNFGVGTTGQYGRYTSSAVDPVDDKTLWTLQEYADMRVGPADNDSRWGTHWGRLGSCGSPLITDEPDSVVACDGGPTSFSVTASESAPPLHYQWRKGGVDIAGETASTLSLAAVGAADVDSYDVLVSDGCGGPVTSMSASLALATTPSISDQPDSALRCTGGSVVFSVTAGSNAPLTYQWRKDNTPIAGETASTLTLSSLTLSDAGSYAVVVDNGCESVISDAAVLMVEVGPEVTDQPDDQVVCVGDPASFSITTNAGSFTFQWRKDGVPIAGETGTTLSIAAVAPSDIGSYDVEVAASCGSVFSAAADLSFNSPVISNQPDPATVCEGELVIMFATATSNPPNQALTYQWRKDGVPLVAGHINPVDQNFIAFNALASDQGLYDVVIDNACSPSVVSSPALLTVNTAPVITVQPVDVQGHHLEPADLTVTATGQGGLSYQWRHMGVPIAGATSPTLHFNRVRPSDLGTYDVVVSTVCGTVTSDTVTLSVDHAQRQRQPVR